MPGVLDQGQAEFFFPMNNRGLQARFQIMTWCRELEVARLRVDSAKPLRRDGMPLAFVGCAVYSEK
jgi:hypothetical protein